MSPSSPAALDRRGGGPSPRPQSQARRRLAPLLGALAAAWSPASAVACTVCYGNAEAPVITGTRLSIVFLLVLTYLVLGGGIAGVVLLRRRARRLATPGPSAPLPLAPRLGAQPQTTEGTT